MSENSIIECMLFNAITKEGMGRYQFNHRPHIGEWLSLDFFDEQGNTISHYLEVVKMAQPIRHVKDKDISLSHGFDVYVKPHGSLKNLLEEFK